jgi:transposase
MAAFLATQRDWLLVERLPAYAPELNPVEQAWANLKGNELANVAAEGLNEVIAAAWHGIERIRPPGTCHTRFYAIAAFRSHERRDGPQIGSLLVPRAPL